MKAKITYGGKEVEIDISPEVKKLLFGSPYNKKRDISIGDTYYSVKANGESFATTFKHSIEDMNRYALNNMFSSEDEAKEQMEKRKIFYELARFATDNNDCGIDFNDTNQPKYYIVKDHYLKKRLMVSSVFSCEHVNSIYFSSNEIAHQAIDKFGSKLNLLFGY